MILRVSKIDLKTQVTHCFNGLQAVEKVRERAAKNMFDVIFMDCNMPFMDGPAATKIIRSHIDEKIKKQVS